MASSEHVETEGTNNDDDNEPHWCSKTFKCPHGHMSNGKIIYCFGICEGPHYSSKTCGQGCCVHGKTFTTHCSFCFADGERYGWDGSVGGCKCSDCAY